MSYRQLSKVRCSNIINEWIKLLIKQMTGNVIYMDHHATTPLHPAVLDAMMPYLTDEFGNPSSNLHEYGRAARLAVEDARKKVSELINAGSPDEIIFTSGATESNNLALKGIAYQYQHKGRHIIISPIEHKAILDPAQHLVKTGFEVSKVPVDRFGIVRLDDLKNIIRKDTILISIQMANSEIGTIQPVAEIAALAQDNGSFFHSDAVQCPGRLKIDCSGTGIDLLSISGHKMYGPKGIGALYLKKGIQIQSLVQGGGQEQGRRSGTLNVPGIVGLGAAAHLAGDVIDSEVPRLLQLRNRLHKGINDRIPAAQLNGHPQLRLPNNLNFSFANVDAESLIFAMPGVALSSGSACTSGALQPSYVLQAIGVSNDLAHCSIRFGLGLSNTEEQINYVLDQLVNHIARLRKAR